MVSETAARPRSLGVVHTVTGLVPVFSELLQTHMQEWLPFNIVDESLLRTTICDGRLSPATQRRVAGHIWSAQAAGAEAVLITCSSIGPAVDAIQPLCDIPVQRVDTGMAEEAIEQGGKIGVLATLNTTLEPTADLIRQRAAHQGCEIQLRSHLCEGAFEALSAGDRAAHDAAVLAGLRELAADVDIVVLAQASMAQVLKGKSDDVPPVPVLSSPELGVRYLKQVLSAG